MNRAVSPAPARRIWALRLVRAAAVLGVCAIVIVSLVPGDLRPSTGFAKTVEHAIAYVLVAALSTAATRGTRAWHSVLFLVVLAGVLEVAQARVPGREPALGDFMASSIGAIIGGGLAALASRLLNNDLRSFRGRPTGSARRAAR